MKRIGCFHSDVDFGVTTHLVEVGLREAAGGEGRGAHADATRRHGTHIARDLAFRHFSKICQTRSEISAKFQKNGIKIENFTVG